MSAGKTRGTAYKETLVVGHSAVDWVDIVVVIGYLLITGYLGWLGYRRTRTAADYLVGGRSVHPIIMAVSYGATFISTAAIVGFGGVAGLFGMSLMWLTFVNIAIGILLAFTVLGEPTRRLGHRLGVHTFPELLGARYQSKGVQVFAGLLIVLFMPLYSAAVMTGGAVFAATQFGVEFEVALLVFALITAAYVIPGGLKAVMYTDTFQGLIMILAMAYLLWFTYTSLGGVEPAHRHLTEMADLVPAPLQAMGHQGWTAMPRFGWGAAGYDLWWTVVTAIILGVGIGVLAQPQLVVRFMTVRSRRELDRAVPIGAIFILLMKETSPGRWAPMINPKTSQPATAPMVVAAHEPAQDVHGATLDLVSGRAPAVVYAKGEADQIIPTFISTALPRWFGLVFFLALLAAAMSTMSSQFHTIGTAAGRDLYERLTGKLVTGGKTSILADYPNWPSVDPIIIALPLSLLTLVLVSALTKASAPQHLRRCFPQDQGR